MNKADIGMIGLAVMGENLVMNMASKGFLVSGYDVDHKRVDNFALGRAKNKTINLFKELPDFINSLKRPRIVMMMIKAGKPVDEVIEKVLPLLDKGDIIIDGGNSHFPDTARRVEYVESKGMLFIGTGVSGGEEGALNGPSIMPGGSKDAWEKVKPILQAISAKVDNGTPCCEWVGEGGAGHFVKMVHNGIEYGDIQLITEVYHIMKNGLKLSYDEMRDIFANWNEGKLESYLIEITANILGFKDTDGLPLVEKILDTAGQKGTGKWTGIASMEEGVPLTLIGEAVYARCLSAMKNERIKAAKKYNKPQSRFTQDKQQVIDDLEKALYAAKIISYAQGYSLMKVAAKSYNWNLNYGGIALMWRGGCIIRSAFLGKIKEAFDKDPNLENLLLSGYFQKEIETGIDSWRRIVSQAMLSGLPVPALASGLTYFDGYTSDRLPANLLQAQRDYFGAHTYERIDRPRGEFFHTNWTGEGGETASTTYNV
ncbi:MAG: decarboxylating NADP(+)-dependent phosphogluconate dehydrogenase [Candidatus Izemoplasmatales bacterium]|jgi:6-phosphogluconate dehydrogenase